MSSEFRLCFFRNIVAKQQGLVFLCLQWVDCVSQLLRMYPFAFEFSSVWYFSYLIHMVCLMQTLTCCMKTEEFGLLHCFWLHHLDCGLLSNSS